MEKYSFGIDIGGTSTKFGLFDITGTLLKKWEITTQTANQGKNILSNVAHSIQETMLAQNIAQDEVRGIGVGIPGTVMDGSHVISAVNLGWNNVPILKELSLKTGMKVKADNDANLAALGEMWKGGGAGYRNMIVVTLGTGIGGGVIINGQIVSGAHGAGGEIGHVHVNDKETVFCNCGNKGCLEQVASARGIVRLAKGILESSNQPSVLRDRPITAKTVFDAVKAEDIQAIAVADLFGDYLGSALAFVAGVVDPEIFVIGGGVSKAGDVLLKYIKKHYTKYAFEAYQNTKFSMAKLGNDAGIYGAAKLIMEESKAHHPCY